jgi:hypothetical protein
MCSVHMNCFTTTFEHRTFNQCRQTAGKEVQITEARPSERELGD